MPPERLLQLLGAAQNAQRAGKLMDGHVLEAFGVPVPDGDGFFTDRDGFVWHWNATAPEKDSGSDGSGATGVLDAASVGADLRTGIGSRPPDCLFKRR